MRKYRHEIDNVRAHMRSLWIFIGIELGTIVVLGFTLLRAPDDIVVHIPPDLRSGATVRPDEPTPANVYAFTFYIFQQLNRWPENGAEDYGKAIYSLSAYLTPKFRSELQKELELKGRRGELINRVRSIHERPGHGYENAKVIIESETSWIVNIDVELHESVKGMSIKQTLIRYPLRVVKFAVDPETNPWRLALDGFTLEGPVRIEDEPEEEE